MLKPSDLPSPWRSWRLGGSIKRSQVKGNKTRPQIRLQAHPPKRQPYKFSVLLLPNFFFFVKDFQKPGAQVTDLEALSHF